MLTIRRTLGLTAACAAVALLGACSTELHGGEITPGTPVGGIPYRVRDRLIMEVYQLGDKGYTRVGSGVDYMADPSRLYFLNFTGQALANANAKFEQRPDGTLTAVHLAGKSQGAATLTAASDAVGAYTTQRAADAKAKTDKETKQQAKIDTGAQQADALVDLTWKAKVADAQLAEKTNDPNAKESEKLDAERLAVEAKRAANAAALKVGQPPPFPGV